MMRSLLLGVAASCLACNGHLDVFQLDAGSAADTGASPDSGEQIGVNVVPADILFVVDNSGSMADEQENLAVNFQSFVDQTIGAADYRIGVVTTDLSSQTEKAGYASYTYSATAPYTLTAFENSGCSDIAIDHGCFRGPDPSARLIDSSQMTRAEQLAAFDANVRVGTCGSGNEQGLETMLAALAQTGPGGCNEGFLRSEANLVIIIVSDEEEANARSIQEIADDLEQYKPWGQIRVATVVGSFGGEASQCAIGRGAECGSICDAAPTAGSHQACTQDAQCPGDETCIQNQCENPDLRYWDYCSSCAYYNADDCCGAFPSSRYIQFAREVEARVHAARPEFPVAQCVGLGSRASCLADTICQASFGDTLARIARELVVKP